MTIINLYTRDQELYTSARPKLAAGNEESVQVYIAFDAPWTGYAKSAVFHTAKDARVFESVLVNNRCFVPKEVIAEGGQLFIGIRGIKDGTVKQSTLVRYKVEQGADGMMVFEPSADVYSQLLNAYGKTENSLSSLEARFNNIVAESGSIEGDEVVDARVGHDGKVHANLHEAITNQVTNRMDYRTNGYVYPPQGANIDIVPNTNDGSVVVTIFADSLTVIVPGGPDYGGYPLDTEEILTYLPNNAALNGDGNLVFTIPEYNALCFDASNEQLKVKSIRTINSYDKVLIYNSWANACGGSFMDFYNRKEHKKIIDFIGLQKTFVYIGSDGRISIDKNTSTGAATITLKNGISYSLCDGDDSTTSASITKDDIVTHLGSKAVLSDDGTLVITLNSYQALCLNLETKKLVIRHLRNIEPDDIVLLYNAWANIQGVLAEKAMDFEIRDVKNDNAFNSGDIHYGIDTAAKCAEFAALFNASAETESFLFFTDPHLLEKGEDYEATMKKFIVTIEKYYKSTPTSFVLCGGDWIGNSDTPTEVKYKLGYIDGFMNGMFDKYYSVLGNHDTNYQGQDAAGNTHAGILDNQTIANLWFRKYGRNYYAFDGNNTRFYVLDCGTDWDDTLSKYRLSQIEWLGNMLKNEDKAHSAIAMHIYFAHDDGRKSTFATAIDELVAAYHNRQITVLNGITYDFSKCKGRIEFIVTGHTHADMLGIAGNDTPVICTVNTRSGNTPSFDLVYADYDNRTVNLVRVGAGSSRVVALSK